MERRRNSYQTENANFCIKSSVINQLKRPKICWAWWFKKKNILLNVFFQWHCYKLEILIFLLQVSRKFWKRHHQLRHGKTQFFLFKKKCDEKFNNPSWIIWSADSTVKSKQRHGSPAKTSHYKKTDTGWIFLQKVLCKFWHLWTKISELYKRKNTFNCIHLWKRNIKSCLRA